MMIFPVLVEVFRKTIIFGVKRRKELYGVATVILINFEMGAGSRKWEVFKGQDVMVLVGKEEHYCLAASSWRIVG